MKKSMLLLILPIFLVIAGFVVYNKSGLMENRQSVEEKLNDFNYVVSTQTVGPKYQFTEATTLVETAREIRKMGSNLLKFSMHPRYCTENYGLPKNDEINSLKKLAQLEPSMVEVLNMDFKYYHIWAYGFSQYTQEPPNEKNDSMQIKFINGYPKSYQKALYDELYDFTSYLLTEFKNTGKIFYLGHWEGDWHLRWDYDRNKPANPKTLKGMIAWEKIRQKAIDDAKKDHLSDVEVYNYIEVNLVMKSIDEPDYVSVTNSIIKEVNPDYVSYSSYDATNPFKTEDQLNLNLKKALDYIESKLSDKSGLPNGKRVWIGEYGSPSVKYSQLQQDERSKWVIKTGLEWGTPFILYWEMYNNEISLKTNEQVGYWLIDDKGEKQLIWYTHHQFYKEAQQYLKKYYQENGSLPSSDEFYSHASTFNSLTSNESLQSSNNY